MSVPFFDAGRLCTSEMTVLPNGEITHYIRWDAPRLPTWSTIVALVELTRKALPGAIVRAVPRTPDIVIQINDGGVEKLIPAYDLADAHLAAGGKMADGEAAVRRVVRALVGYTD